MSSRAAKIILMVKDNDTSTEKIGQTQVTTFPSQIFNTSFDNNATKSTAVAYESEMTEKLPNLSQNSSNFDAVFEELCSQQENNVVPPVTELSVFGEHNTVGKSFSQVLETAEVNMLSSSNEYLSSAATYRTLKLYDKDLINDIVYIPLEGESNQISSTKYQECAEFFQSSYPVTKDSVDTLQQNDSSIQISDSLVLESDKTVSNKFQEHSTNSTTEICEKSNNFIMTEPNGTEITSNPEINNKSPVQFASETINVQNSSQPLLENGRLLSESNEETLEEKEPNVRSRWKRAAPHTWAKNISKQQRSECLPYKTSKGTQKAKAPQQINCNSCRFKCSDSFTEEERLTTCRLYWSLSYERKKDFILQNVKQNEPQKRRVRTESGKNRALSRSYHFFKKDGDMVRVCQAFFTKTLNITDGPIIHAFKNVNESQVFNKPDQRGKKSPSNKTSDTDITRVKQHIEKFPVMESHYCRQSSLRLYLDANLSISKMYELYSNECKTNNWKPVSAITYRRIFGTNYNYSFYKPKKDQCLTCTNFNSASADEKHKLESSYKEHRNRADCASKCKAEDKERSQNDSTFLSATFDLQSVLQIPATETSQLYYSRKLCVYNLCIYESRVPNNAYCIAWSELHGKRGSVEIGSSLLWWLQQIPPTVKAVSLFSDTCGGQNRNQHIASLFLYAVQCLPLDVIEHKFLESGHSYMEVDSMHSAIEKQKRNVPVYSMIDWLNIFRTARSSRKRKDASPYTVKELTFQDMVDLKDLSSQFMKNRNKDENGSDVSWLKIKCLKYEKCLPGIIQYRYDYSSPYIKINVTPGKGRPIIAANTKLKKAYSKLLPISKEKKQDLERLCNLKIIPSELHGWYKALPTSKTAGNRAPVPGIESDDDSDV